MTIGSRELEFSYFMMKRTTRRWGMNTMLYAAEPWAVIHGTLAGSIASNPDRKAAESFVRQAQVYFSAADRAEAFETRPLLYYYAFLNLGKALAMAKGRSGLVGKVSHGIAAVNSSGHAVNSAELQLQRSGSGAPSAADELHRALEHTPVPTPQMPVRQLIAQSVVAHRLWSAAAGRKERFLAVEGVLLQHDAASKSIWATLYVRADTMRSRKRPINETLTEGSLASDFRSVTDFTLGGVNCRSFEQSQPVTYQARASDKVMEVVATVRSVLWQTVTIQQPHRQYYLYLSPPGEQRYPQWLTIYAVLFWLGSLTRYQPVQLLEILEGPYGAFFREFLATQPTQLLYLFASEFLGQDVSRPSVV